MAVARIVSMTSLTLAPSAKARSALIWASSKTWPSTTRCGEIFVWTRVFGAAIAVAVSRFALALVLYFSGAYPWDVLWNESIVILPLMMFPEAFITGLLITLFVVYLPDWVKTFDDERYIHGK